MNNKKVDPPGWNDPPMLNYNASNPPPKTRITNKRVAFPVSTTTAKSQTTSSLPPSMPPIATEPPSTSAQENTDLFESSKCNLEKFFSSEKDKLNFCELWSGGKFSQECQEDIHLLSKYLVEDNLIDAQDIKNRILLKYRSLCEPWLNKINI